MGQKINPYGFRLGVSRTWTAKWYADKEYTASLKEDIAIRQLIDRRLANASVSGSTSHHERWYVVSRLKATKVANMAISPWAKLGTSVACSTNTMAMPISA